MNTATTTEPNDSAIEAARLAKSEELRARMRKGQAKMAEMRAAGWKPVLLNPVEKAKANPNSPKLAIKAMCWTCVGADADPGAKFRVRDCGLKNKCPLWVMRPWQNVKGGLVINADGIQVVAPGGSDTDEDDSEAETGEE